MASGNGDAGLPSLRWLRTVWSRPKRGPFTGPDVVRAIEAEGWKLFRGDPNPWHTYHHPENPGILSIDPNWAEIWEGDMTFEIVRGRMGVSAKRMLELLQDKDVG
jgi:hypothetical protein